MLQPIESRVGVFDLVQMCLKRFAYIETLGPPRQSRQLFEAGFHFVGNSDCKHDRTSLLYCLYDKYSTCGPRTHGFSGKRIDWLLVHESSYRQTSLSLISKEAVLCEIWSS